MTVKKFSLIEMLIVIAVIGILFSLLEPSLRGIVSNAHKLGCSENLRKIGSSYHLYAEDNDDEVADCLFIGSISHKVIYKNETLGNYGAAKYSGRFHNGQAGYLEPYLGEAQENYVCPGSEFTQGVDTFGSSRFSSRIATYTSFSPFNFMVRKRSQDYVINPTTDEMRGWNTKTVRPVYLDPVRSMVAWYRNRIGQGGSWDQVGSVIHENRKELPILMSDGHVFMYDRDSYPLQYINETGYTNYFLMINQIMSNF